MGQYTIDQFSKITGLNKILIRTWENRYGFLKPKRTSTNIRYYNDRMLTEGIKYAILVENGHKISKLVSYNTQKIDELIQNTLQSNTDVDVRSNIYIAKFIESAVNFNQHLFDETYRLCLIDFDIIEFYIKILIQTMNKISILFLNSKITPAHEHFLSENIRLKICAEIEKINSKDISEFKDEWVLFLPELEYHDISLLFANFLLKRNNHSTIYLGQNTPRESLLEFVDSNKNFLLFLTSKRKKGFTDELYQFLSSNFPKSDIYCIERELSDAGKNDKVKRISTIDNFIEYIS